MYLVLPVEGGARPDINDKATRRGVGWIQSRCKARPPQVRRWNVKSLFSGSAGNVETQIEEGTLISLTAKTRHLSIETPATLSCGYCTV